MKNLENVQGDKRDVVFISIGYDKDAHGYMAQSFGPISTDGGERRLNVLFTRARKRCRVFSSIRHSDIRLDATRHAGPRVLKSYLKYAETGEMDVPVLQDLGADSPFEEAVVLALTQRGYKVSGQVGTAGFRIDLAVHDPDDEGRFLLAVECDGARYHSSAWARERDRLRQSVLEDKGWVFHRIWSTDWFQNPEPETRKLIEAINRARHGIDERQTLKTLERAPVERKTPEEQQQPERLGYEEAKFYIEGTHNIKIHECTLESLGDIVAGIVKIEGPVHLEEVARRVSRLWGLARAGKRIQAAVKEAAIVAERRGLIQGSEPDSPFLEVPGAPVRVRDRSEVESATLRKIGMLPPTECRATILQAVERSIVISRAHCAIETARLLGYRSTSAALREFVISQVDNLLSDGRLIEKDSWLRLP